MLDYKSKNIVKLKCKKSNLKYIKMFKKYVKYLVIKMFC